MKRVICDTNIWYGLGAGRLTVPASTTLVATWINVMELGYAHPDNKKDFSLEDRRNASRAILNSASHIEQLDPFEHATNLLFPSHFTFSARDLRSILQIISSDQELPSSSLFQKHKQFYEGFNSVKDDFVSTLTQFKHSLRKEINVDTPTKNKFKARQADYFKFRAMDVLEDVSAYLEQIHNKQIVFDSEDDMKQSLVRVEKQFAAYIQGKQSFIRNLSLDKTMVVEPNDFFDLLTLLYISKEDKFWTLETRWKNILRAGGIDDVLYSD